MASDGWIIKSLAQPHLGEAALQPFLPPEPRRSLLVLWNAMGGAAKVAYSHNDIAGFYGISPDDFEVLAYTVPAFRGKHLATDALTAMMQRLVATRGMTTFRAAVQQGSPGEALAAALKFREASRQNGIVEMSLTLSPPGC